MSKGAAGLTDEQKRKMKEEEQEQQAALANNAAQDVVAPVQDEFVPPANDQVAATQLQQGAVQPAAAAQPQVSPTVENNVEQTTSTQPQVPTDPAFRYAMSQVPANEEERRERYRGNLNKEISGKGGTMDFFATPPVTGQQIKDANWEGVKGDEPGTLWLFDVPAKESGFKKNLTVSAVNVVGDVLTPDQVSAYLGLLYSATGGDVKKAIELDKPNLEDPESGGFGIIAGIDLSEGETQKIYELYHDYNAKPIPNLGTDYVIDSDDDSGVEDNLVIDGTYSNDEENETGKSENVPTSTSDVKSADTKGDGGDVSTDNTGDEGNRTFAYTDSSGNMHAVGMAYKDSDSKARSKDLSEYYNNLVAESGGDYEKLLELDRERDNLIVGNNGAARQNVSGGTTDKGPATPSATTTTTPKPAAETPKTEVSAPKQNRTSAPKAGYSKRQQQTRDNAVAEMDDKERQNGNVKVSTHPTASPDKLKEWGEYDAPSLAVQEMDVDKKDGWQSVYYTPVKADGTVLTKAEADEYFDKIGEKAVKEGADILELDRKGYGIIIRSVDSKDDDPNQDYAGYVNNLRGQYDTTPEEYASRAKEAGERLGSLGGNQNPVALRPVSRQAMVDAGWEFFSQYPDDEIYAYPFYWEITDDEKKPHGVIFTPITKDGDVLGEEAFFDYIQSLNDNPKPLEADKKWGLILKYDADPEDVEAIEKDINDWRMGQTDPSDDEPLTFRGDNYDDMLSWFDSDIAARQKEYDNAKAGYEAFMKDPSGTTSGQLILSQQQKTVEEHNMTPEERKKIEKRQKTARIIANIGDILQGFANLAGTWYGANSSDLSSLSAAVDKRAQRENADWTKRYNELVSSSQKALDELRKSYASELKESFKELQKAKDRKANFMSSTGKSSYTAQLREEQHKRDSERKREEQERKQKWQEKKAEDDARRKKEFREFDSKLKEREYEKKAQLQKEVKQTPGAKARR